MEDLNEQPEEVLKASDLECDEAPVVEDDEVIINTEGPKRKKSPRKTIKTKPISKKLATARSLRSKSLVLSPSPAPAAATLMTRSLTKPISPNFKIEKRLREHRKSVMSSEEMEFAKVQQEIAIEQERCAKAQRTYQKLRSNGFRGKAVSSSQHSVKKLTIPCAPRSVLTQKRGEKIPSALRKSPTKAAPSPRKSTSLSPRKPTIPQPFHFRTDERLKGSIGGASQSGVSLTAGELAQKFMSDPRSHYVPENVGKKLTEAHSPVLQTKKRSEGHASHAAPPSYNEKLEQELKEMLSFKFKARPLDKRIFESNGELGVPKVPPKAPTVPVDVALESDRRALAHHKAKSPEEEAPAQFKALPLPSTTHVPVRPRSPSPFQPTQPVSPKLHGGDRASSAPPRRQKPSIKEVERKKREEEEKRRKRASSAGRKSVTQPQAPHLLTEERGVRYEEMMKEFLRQEEELARERAQVKAMPLPTYKAPAAAAGSSPRAHKPSLTTPQPFELQSVARHQESEQRLKTRLEREEKAQEEKARSFKALPVPPSVLHPLPPKEAENTPPACTIPQSPPLKSNARAAQRSAYDAQTKERLAREAAEKEQQELRQREKEEQEMHALRRKSIQEGGLVFKATPLPSKDPLPFKAQPQPRAQPTIPQSPNFKLKERRASKKDAAAEGLDKAKKSSKALLMR